LSRVIVFCVGWGFFGADASTKVTPADDQNFMVYYQHTSDFSSVNLAAMHKLSISINYNSDVSIVPYDLDLTGITVI